MTAFIHLSRQHLLHEMAKSSLELRLPKAIFINFVDHKVRTSEHDFYKVIWDLKVEATRMLTEALEQQDQFHIDGAKENLKILNAIV